MFLKQWPLAISAIVLLAFLLQQMVSQSTFNGWARFFCALMFVVAIASRNARPPV